MNIDWKTPLYYFTIILCLHQPIQIPLGRPCFQLLKHQINLALEHGFFSPCRVPATAGSHGTWVGRVSVSPLLWQPEHTASVRCVLLLHF